MCIIYSKYKYIYTGIVSLGVLILFIIYKNNNIKIFVINNILLTIINILFMGLSYLVY
jgi:hypothetical protein